MRLLSCCLALALAAPLHAAVHPLRLTGQYRCADDVGFRVRANIDGRTIYLYLDNSVYALQAEPVADGFLWHGPVLRWQGDLRDSTVLRDGRPIANHCRKP
ncbi:hypothetical protein N8I74_06315 [Chitiniphilus purpureus]|uniref:C-type lysozyme inhibitor domain-containing protein n=1 Tax=Chitiniphilus purpureus TaxID=2981137 RepID=A0ABY6DQH4_9NEIS|nr:hypothetical protein [Chitiniphilus sp. CD1]UXY16629.1 hypothetical protein N8I74_06315 [Chitiniphilus sp. CD1]